MRKVIIFGFTAVMLLCLISAISDEAIRQAKNMPTLSPIQYTSTAERAILVATQQVEQDARAATQQADQAIRASTQQAAAGATTVAMIQGGIDAEATRSAAQQEANLAAARAQQLQGAQTATAAAFEREQIQAARAATARADEANRQATAAASATAAQEAWIIRSWTATADAVQATSQAQFVAAQATAAASATTVAYQYTQTAVVAAARQTEDANAYLARVRARTERRDDMVNNMLAWAPWIAGGVTMLSLIAATILVAIKYWKRPIVIMRDARGDAPLLVSNVGDVTDMDRSPAASIRFLKTGPQAAQLASESTAERTIARDQAVDLATRGLAEQFRQPAPGISRSVAQRAMPSQLVPTAGGPNYRIYGPNEIPTSLIQDPAAMQALDVDWQEAR